MSDTGSTQPFNAKTVFGMLLFGAIAFIAALYFISTGKDNRNDNDGGAHAGGKGLNGYAAIASWLEDRGHDVTLSRNQGQLTNDALLILTPPTFADAETVNTLIDDRRFVGPTIVILPKWHSVQLQDSLADEAKTGWVELAGTSVPDWTFQLDRPFDIAVNIANIDGQIVHWTGLDQSGVLPEPTQVMSLAGAGFEALVSTPNGDILVGYVQGADAYSALNNPDSIGPSSPSDSEPIYDEFGDQIAPDEPYADHEDYEKEYYSHAWPVIFVAEPDIFNNYGFADAQRAQLAHDIIDLAMDGADLPIIFDLTLNGFGGAENLLTLAFTPPFFAATLCLLIAMVVIAWRAFRRFGPAIIEDRPIAFGKARLVKNSAGFIQRSRRLHLLSQPYAGMVRDRIVRALALRNPDNAAIDQAVSKRLPKGSLSYSQSVANLLGARTPQEILRAAAALKSLERMITK